MDSDNVQRNQHKLASLKSDETGHGFDKHGQIGRGRDSIRSKQRVTDP